METRGPWKSRERDIGVRSVDASSMHRVASNAAKQEKEGRGMTNGPSNFASINSNDFLRIHVIDSFE